MYDFVQCRKIEHILYFVQHSKHTYILSVDMDTKFTIHFEMLQEMLFVCFTQMSLSDRCLALRNVTQLSDVRLTKKAKKTIFSNFEFFHLLLSRYIRFRQNVRKKPNLLVNASGKAPQNSLPKYSFFSTIFLIVSTWIFLFVVIQKLAYLCGCLAAIVIRFFLHLAHQTIPSTHFNTTALPYHTIYVSTSFSIFFLLFFHVVIYLLLHRWVKLLDCAVYSVWAKASAIQLTYYIECVCALCVPKRKIRNANSTT